MDATHQRKMVKPETRPRPGVPEPITRVIRAVFIRRHPRRVADNTLRPRHLSICDLRRARGGGGCTDLVLVARDVRGDELREVVLAQCGLHTVLEDVVV